MIKFLRLQGYIQVDTGLKMEKFRLKFTQEGNFPVFFDALLFSAEFQRELFDSKMIFDFIIKLL